MYPEKRDLLGIFHGLMTPISGIQGFTRVTLEKNNVCNNMPTEIIEWLEKRASTFDRWNEELGKLRSNNKNLNATELCEQLVDALGGLETTMAEGNDLCARIELEGQERKIFAGIVGTLPVIYDHYKQMQEFLRQE